MSLLTIFCSETTKQFVEPQRKGTPKGDPIGISRGRFDASLHSLYDYDQTKVAELSEVSYGVLKKWRTEQSFKNLLSAQQDDFCENYLFPYLTGGSIKYHTGIPRHGFSKMFTMEIDDALSDAQYFSKGLKETICRKLLRRLKSFGLSQFVEFGENIAYLLSHWNAPELTKIIVQSIVRSCNEKIIAALADTASSDQRIEANRYATVISIMIEVI